MTWATSSASATFHRVFTGTDDLGSALTFVPMAFGMLYAAGMQLRWIANANTPTSRNKTA